MIYGVRLCTVRAQTSGAVRIGMISSSPIHQEITFTRELTDFVLYSLRISISWRLEKNLFRIRRIILVCSSYSLYAP